MPNDTSSAMSAAASTGKTWAWRLAVGHFAFLLGVLAGKPFVPYPAEATPDVMSFDPWHIFGDMVAARYFHHAYEHILVKVVTIVDLPALLLGGVTIDALATAFLNRFYASYAHAASWLLLGSAEWFLLGLFIDRRKRRAALLRNP